MMEYSAPAGQEMDIALLTLPEIREIYRERVRYDFPENEVKPLAMIEKLFGDGRYLCCGAGRGGDAPAYAFFVLAGDVYLLDYFAVRKDLRGSGIGSRFLKELGRSCFGKAACVLLEVDDPAFAGSEEEKALCGRRLAFYLRNGMLDTGARARTFGANFLILEFPPGKPHSRGEAEALYARVYRSMLPERVFENMVLIR